MSGHGKKHARRRIAVSGASGLIGSVLVTSLLADGHDVVKLVRHKPLWPDEVQWDPAEGTVDLDALAGVNAVVHLAGAGVGDKRWTDSYKKVIRDSRVDGTRTIATAMAGLTPTPDVLVSASAIGYYGDTGDRAVDESAPRGDGFLAEVCEEWEAAADPARDAGIRVVHPRTGLVVSRDGGAWARLFPIFKAGLGGKMGSGRQYWSFISMRDEVAALTFLLNGDLSGPVNLTAPNPVTNADVTAAMGRVLGRPTLLPVPSFALKAALGEFSGDVLGSQRVLPAALQGAGFTWSDPTIDDAVRSALAAAA
jgi:uncharacterized protein (TIGR01777 family)